MTLDSDAEVPPRAEELAAQINMDPAVLFPPPTRVTTSSAKRARIRLFGKPAEFLNAIDGDTIYAIQ
jgi:hypothetical protein